MQQKYIKVTVGDNEPIVITAANESFYKSRKDVKIDEPTQEEIIKFFPEEAKKPAVPKIEGKNIELEKVQAELKATTEQLKDVAADYNKKSAELETEKSEHEKTKAALVKAQDELKTIKKSIIS